MGSKTTAELAKKKSGITISNAVRDVAVATSPMVSSPTPLAQKLSPSDVVLGRGRQVYCEPLHKRNLSSELPFSRNSSLGDDHSPHARRSSSQYNFCNSCNLEHLRRLNDEEQRKYQEIEAIKREKETLLQQPPRHQGVLFLCNRLENPNEHRKIGKLSLQDRYLKIKRFKEKKQRRIWTKKIFYDCRFIILIIC